MYLRRAIAAASAATLLLAAGCASVSPGSSNSLNSVSAHPTVEASAVEPSAGPDSTVAWIVSQWGDGLRLVSPDGGTSFRLLTDGSLTALHADWSSDGKRLAFNVDEADGTRDVWVSNWDGSDPQRLIDCQLPCRDADSPAWSPSGEQIAFSRIDNVDGHNPGSEVQLVDVDTGEVSTVLATQGAEYAGGPRWSPDGTSMVVEFDTYIDDGNDTSEFVSRAIGVIDLSAAEPQIRVLTSLDTFSSYPDWHPTEDLILFAAGASDPLDPSAAPQNLFTIRPDGTGLTQITHQSGSDDGIWMPAFRRDGSGILATFVHRPGPGLTLAVLGLDGSGLAELGGSDPVFAAHARQRPLP